MKKTLLITSLIAFGLFSCDEKSSSTTETHTSGDASSAELTSVNSSKSTSSILDAYLAVKDALVADDSETASDKSKELVAELKNYDITSAQANDPEELERLQVEAIGFAENLEGKAIATQRESFQALSANLKDFLKIAGTDRTIYHQYCPMYKNNTGGMWLSDQETIRNPLFGSAMLACGSVEETISPN
ncbi:MAG: DUF3347 domain-containing protein [Bacteroidota bacterium]